MFILEDIIEWLKLIAIIIMLLAVIFGFMYVILLIIEEL